MGQAGRGGRRVSVTDYGAIWAQDHLRKALGLAGARVLDGGVPRVEGARSGSTRTACWSISRLRERLHEIVENWWITADACSRRRRKLPMTMATATGTSAGVSIDPGTAIGAVR